MMIRFVTSNRGKFEEAKRILNGVDLAWERMEYREVQADTNREVAIQSLRELKGIVKDPFFLEDSGLYIDALNGFPGPYSSYTFKKIGCKGILKLMEDIEDRRAYFTSVIAAFIDGKEILVEGTVRGRIAEEERGGGWGFDPIFEPDGAGGLTFGELGERKDLFSHRGLALRRFLRVLRDLKYI
ncbi:MAG: RdgB/HAM1 family non-canonical purine NTP pyrophosphatase [Candidatus Methanodesulfokora sp.]